MERNQCIEWIDKRLRKLKISSDMFSISLGFPVHKDEIEVLQAILEDLHRLNDLEK